MGSDIEYDTGKKIPDTKTQNLETNDKNVHLQLSKHKSDKCLKKASYTLIKVNDDKYKLCILESSYTRIKRKRAKRRKSRKERLRQRRPRKSQPPPQKLLPPMREKLLAPLLLPTKKRKKKLPLHRSCPKEIN